jgi:hypothetical protein
MADRPATRVFEPTPASCRAPPGTAPSWSVRSVPSRNAWWRAAPTQTPPMAGAEALHLLRDLWPTIPSATGTWQIADREAGVSDLATTCDISRGNSSRNVGIWSQAPPGTSPSWSDRSVHSRRALRRAAPTQAPPMASAETPHLLRDLWPMIPSTTGTRRIADPETKGCVDVPIGDRHLYGHRRAAGCAWRVCA